MAKEKESKVKNENKHFMKDVKAELKKVTWPTSKQMVNNVTAVLVIVLVTAAIVFCLDFVFGAMNKYGVEKIKENVQSKEQSNVVENVVDKNQNNGENTDESATDNNAGETQSSENTENTENNTTDNKENN